MVTFIAFLDRNNEIILFGLIDVTPYSWHLLDMVNPPASPVLSSIPSANQPKEAA
jgi:hypothetical protein